MPGAIERVTSTQGIIGPRVRNALPQRQLPDRSELDDVVEHFWQTSWDFPPGRPQTTETLPFPCQHLTFERLDGVCSIRITGLYRRVWQRELSGEGEVFGIKFRPAGFHAALGLAPGEFTDRTADGAGIPGIADLAARIWHSDEFAERCQAAQDWLSPRARPTDRTRLANRMVQAMQGNPALRVGADLERLFAISTRSANRLLTEQVGLGSKWILSRARLQSAAEHLAARPQCTLAELAAEAGYADQAHFSRDFARVLGRPPNSYRKELTAVED